MHAPYRQTAKMTDRSIVDALNEFADTLNDAADRHAVPLEPGSPIVRMVEQCKRAAATLPQPSEPTKWEPSNWLEG
jgi:hypothetical protein